MRGGNPLSGLLQSVIGDMEAANRVRESLALAYWSRIAGEQAAAASEAESVRDGLLIVRTKSSVWSHELTMHKPHLIESLNRILGGRCITDIRFRAQGISPDDVPEEALMPSPGELSLVVLEDDERDELNEHLESLASISDDHARQAIATRLTNEFRLRHWRLEHGWRLCLHCSAAHKTDFTLCPICRLCT